MNELYAFSVSGRSKSSLKWVLEFLCKHSWNSCAGYNTTTNDDRDLPNAKALTLYTIMGTYEINRGATKFNNTPSADELFNIVTQFIDCVKPEDLEPYGIQVDTNKPYEIGWRIRSSYDFCIRFTIEPVLFSANDLQQPADTIRFSFAGENEDLLTETLAFILQTQPHPQSFATVCIDKSELKGHNPQALIMYCNPANITNHAANYPFPPTPIVLTEQIMMYIYDLTDDDIEAFGAEERGYEEHYELGWRISNDQPADASTIVVRPAHIEYGK